MLYTTHNFFNNETMESTKPQNIPGFCTLIMGTQSQLGANFTLSMILDKMCWGFFLSHLFGAFFCQFDSLHPAVLLC